jgi:GTP-binding protein EngB required for normal cell division
MNTLEDLQNAISEELDMVDAQTPYVADMIKTNQGREEVSKLILEYIVAGNTISQAIVLIDNTYDINNPDNG